MRHHHRAGFLMFTLGVLLVSTGAAWPLNPLVTRNPNPVAAVPVECEQGLAPAPMPRVNVAEIPAPEIVPASIPAPPSRTLRRTLEDAHEALVRNDRPAFDAALSNARLIVRDYPPGAERTAAEEAVRAYDDAAFVWDAQFRSPFFDQGSEAYTRASRYPGYAEAVRRGVFTDDRERRFYPASESRQFLTRVASERLERLGIRTPAPAPTRIARAERRPTRPVAASSPSPSSSPSSSPSVSAPRRTTPRRAATNTKSRKSATPAIAAPASPDPPAPTRTVAESAPAAPSAAAPTPAADPASPDAEGEPLEDVPEPATAAAPGTVAETPGPPPAVDAPPPAPDPAPAVPATTERRWLVPALLIGLGLGVLFVLFRVSK